MNSMPFITLFLSNVAIHKQLTAEQWIEYKFHYKYIFWKENWRQ